MKFHEILSLLIIVILNITNLAAVIVGYGSRVTGKEFNWVVRIVVSEPNTNRISTSSNSQNSHQCTGSIISELHILTAAHCFRNTREEWITVLAGEICSEKVIPRGNQVKKIHRHPSYGAETVPSPILGDIDLLINDLAVLTLEDPLVLGKNIGIIGLTTQLVDFSSQDSGCKMAGWGLHPAGTFCPNLQWTSLKVYDYNQYDYCQIRNKLMCARHPENYTFATPGDSGAGLLCQGVVVGVLKGGASEFGQPVIFQSVFHFLPFIYGVLKQDAALLAAIRRNNRVKRNKPCICL